MMIKQKMLSVKILNCYYTLRTELFFICKIYPEDRLKTHERYLELFFFTEGAHIMHSDCIPNAFILEIGNNVGDRNACFDFGSRNEYRRIGHVAERKGTIDIRTIVFEINATFASFTAVTIKKYKIESRVRFAFVVRLQAELLKTKSEYVLKVIGSKICCSIFIVDHWRAK